MNINQLILEKTAHLFKVYGIKGNTMDDIANAAGISKKTLYQYYENKEQLIEQVLDYQYEIFNQKIQVTNQSKIDAIDQLIRFNVILLELLKSINPASTNDLKKSYHPIYIQTKNRFTLLFHEAITKNIEEGKESGIYRDDINNEIITNLHTNRIEQYLETNILWNNDQNFPEIFKEIIAYYLYGLVNNKGQELLTIHLTQFSKYLSK